MAKPEIKSQLHVRKHAACWSEKKYNSLWGRQRIRFRVLPLNITMRQRNKASIDRCLSHRETNLVATNVKCECDSHNHTVFKIEDKRTLQSTKLKSFSIELKPY